MTDYREIHSLTLITILGCALSGCVNPTYEPPKLQASASFAEATADESKAAVPVDWWSAFNDRQLDALMQDGLSQNLDVRQAVERINEAQANVRVANAGLFPTMTGGAGYGRGDTNGDGTRTKGYPTFATSWMIDLFGGLHAAGRSAKAKLDAAYLTADVARLTMLSAIASAYVDLRYYQADIILTEESIEGRKKNLELTRQQQQAGGASLLMVAQSKQLVLKAEADLPELEVNFESELARLATLTGQRISVLRPELQSASMQPRARFHVSVGVPADVLRNRPDVRAAERNLAAAAESVGVAKAALYPSLQLSGYVTPTYVMHFGHEQIWDAAASTALTIFDGGKNLASLSAARSQMTQARLAWESAVLTAVEDVEKALAAYNRDDRNVATENKLVATSRQVLEFSRDSFKLGAGSFTDVLDAEQNLLTAQQSRAQAIRQQATNYVALCVAAVGGVEQ